MKRVVWVIDDDEIYQMIIKKLIKNSGAYDEAIFYLNAQKAIQDLENFKTQLPSVILLDINMPMMDGWQFLKLLEETYPSLYNSISIYMVTSSIAYSDKDKLNEFPGVAGFLSKPLDVEKLKEIGKSLK